MHLFNRTALWHSLSRCSYKVQGSLVYEIDHPDNSKPGKKLSWESQVTRSEIDISNPKMTSGDMMLALLAGTGALCVILSFSLSPSDSVSQKSLPIHVP